MAQDKNAANDGDLLKHALLSEVLGYCADWPALTYAETHAGAGIYEAAKQIGSKPFICNLQCTIANLSVIPTQLAGGQFTALLKSWWLQASNDGLYPGSVYQALMLLKNVLGCKELVVRVTEASEKTHSRLKTALSEFKIAPELSGFQFKIDWLTEKDPLFLLIDPFAYANDKSGIAKGFIDLDSLQSLLSPCWQKQACVVGFWCAGSHSPGSIQRVKFIKSLKAAATDNNALLRNFRFAHYSMTLLGIGIGKQVVTRIPRRNEWVVWLRRVVKEDLADQVRTVFDPVNADSANDRNSLKP